MSINRTLSDLRDKTQEILKLCKQSNEPIFVQDNGNEELVIMSREYYEQIRNLLNAFNRQQKYSVNLKNQFFHVEDVNELYQKLDEADNAILNNDFHSHDEVLEKLRNQLNGSEKK